MQRRRVLDSINSRTGVSPERLSDELVNCITNSYSGRRAKVRSGERTRPRVLAMTSSSSRTFLLPATRPPVALKVRCGEGAATSTRGRVRSPETPAALRYIQVIQPTSSLRRGYGTQGDRRSFIIARSSSSPRRRGHCRHKIRRGNRLASIHLPASRV